MTETSSTGLADAPSVRELADRYIDQRCVLDPIKATGLGVPGHDDRLTDVSPEGTEARAAQAREALVALARIEPADDDERRGAAVMAERLGTELALVDAGEPLRALNNLASPVQAFRQVFDMMPRDEPEHWEHIRARMDALPEALARYRASLDAGLAAGLPAARRQALTAAEQCRAWAGEGGLAPSYFAGLVEQAANLDRGRQPSQAEVGRAEPLPATLLADLERAADVAAGAYAELGRYLHDDYAPRATVTDGVGRDRYVELARASLGAEIDPVETYEWGWEELALIEAEMAALADAVLPSRSPGRSGRPGASIEEAIAHLEGDDTPLVIEGEADLRAWLQHLMDGTIAGLEGRHFDIPVPVRRVEAMIAPPGGAAAMYYTGPSEDLSRPGRTWYPTQGRTRFPLWGEVSIAYHEGVPGHHLQVGQVMMRRQALTRFHRTTFVSGHGEGWALYAERLMEELGRAGDAAAAPMADPAHRLGMWRAQALRAVRVIVDIGMHLGLDIPHGQPFHPGERWTPELGQSFVEARGRFPVDFLRSEVLRYLGWPGQAISYKVGERVWLAGRAAAERRHGADFDLKAFHGFALDLGPLGLDLLAEELSSF